MDQLGAIVDQIAETDRMLSTVAARRAELVESARRFSIAATADIAAERAHLVKGKPGGWDATTVAHRELVTEIACALRLPERTAENLLEHSRALVNELPTTFASLLSGEISYRHAQVMVEHATTIPADAVPAFEGSMLSSAKKLTAPKFDRKVRVERERAHPDSIAVRAGTAREGRTVLFEPSRDGMAWLTAYLPAELALAAYNRISDIAAGLNDATESRTRAQLRADVASDLLIDGVTDEGTDAADSFELDGFTVDDIEVLRTMQWHIFEDTGVDMPLGAVAAASTPTLPAAASTPTPLAPTGAPIAPTGTPTPTRTASRRPVPNLGRGIRARVLVTVPVMTLLDHSDEPGVLEGYGPIDPDVAKRLAAGAPSFTRLLTHPETGAVLSVGRDSYTVPNDLRIWLRIRDETCRFVGCSRAARSCEIDHSLDWAYDGFTEHDNLAHLCPAHHHLKHHTSWAVKHGEHGVLDWTSPAGRHYLAEPATRMSTPPRFS